MENKERVITYSEKNKIRIDTYLTREGVLSSRSQIQQLIRQGKIRVNQQMVKASYLLKNGDIITLFLSAPKAMEVKAEKIPLNIIYEDEYLVIVNKPAGMIVHPAGKVYSGTLVNALLYHCKNSLSGIGGIIRPGIIHRLDKDTSGLMVVAKNNLAHLELSHQMKSRKIDKRYIALVWGKVKEEQGIIDAPIGRSVHNRKKMAVGEGKNKSAITHFKVLKRFFRHTLLEVKIYTGRTHQIRVHLSYLGYPIVGDKVYGQKKEELIINRQALHSYWLGFSHPFSHKYLEFHIPLSEDIQKCLESLENNEKNKN